MMMDAIPTYKHQLLSYRTSGICSDQHLKQIIMLADITDVDVTLIAKSAQHHVTIVPDVKVVMADVMVVARLDTLAMVVVVDKIIANLKNQPGIAQDGLYIVPNIRNQLPLQIKTIIFP